ncbi:DNA repair protein [Zalerion maritima]|uniref:DNA repair protein n=1 Tax=Zalerion maritima TaxID=339359 RepID=A0AAD5RJW3_9PEZI|nr:DNA repair protein [Zalerion maritima]
MASKSSGSAQPVKLSLPLQQIFQSARREDSLVILARGLGLLRLVTNLLHSYDAAGANLVLVVGADEGENSRIGEALAEHAAVSQSPRARGLAVVNTDLMGVAERERAYRCGGVFSVTSRILVVDLLTGLVDPETISGVLVLHAEKVTATSLEAFILRIYRQRNKNGFLKAVADDPRPFVRGFNALAGFMQTLFLRKVSLWPRFHVDVARDLEGRRKAEVVELEVEMTDGMREIQNSILACVEASMRELKRINVGLDLGGGEQGTGEEWNLDSALLKDFDAMVRRQLDPNWHRVSWKTKQIVSDLTTLRGMLGSLLAEDAVSFLKHLDAIHAAHSPTPGSNRQSQSPWLFLDAAQTIFETAKNRVYERKGNVRVGEESDGKDILASVSPVLEEQPKWAVLASVLEEIERDLYLDPTNLGRDDSNGTILIMCQDVATCRQIRDFLQTMHVKPNDGDGSSGSSKAKGRRKEHGDMDEDGDGGSDDKDGPSASFMMRKRLRDYLKWKKDFAHVSQVLFQEAQQSIRGAVDPRTNLAAGSKSRPPPNKRRRVRGGGGVGSTSTTHPTVNRTEQGALAPYFESPSEASALDTSISVPRDSAEASALETASLIAADPLEDMDEYFTLYDPADLIVVHAYGESGHGQGADQDDRVLEEIKPRYIIMYEPSSSAAFIRRVEVYRSSHTDRNVRVYFMYYGGSVEEQRYLAEVRREKEWFTRLIRERASMSLVLDHVPMKNSGETGETGEGDVQEDFLRTINTRIAGGGNLNTGGKTATATPPRVIVDIREFRSTLPSLLHANNVVVVPCMLTVGDYVLSPNICVERKSISDLISSFKDGRLYQQCEGMFAHYRDVMLLVEFEQNRSFTLDPFVEFGSSAANLVGAGGTGGTGTGGTTGGAMGGMGGPNVAPDLQSKIVLLTLAFPKLRIIWSSSPYQTASIFQALKSLEEEPDPIAAVRAGNSDAAGLVVGGGAAAENMFNVEAREMLSAIPGVTDRNVHILMRRCENVREVANLDEEELREMIGREAARKVRAFFGRDICSAGGGDGY